MPISLKHKFTSAKADGGDLTLVQPTNWNDEHDLIMPTNRLLGRTTAGEGPVEEISVGDGLTLSGGSLSFDSVVVPSQFIPGIMVDYAGPTAPSKWLICDGSAISRTTYAALFAVIGTTYGAGNGTTTFNIPDTRGRVTASPDGGSSRLGTSLTGSLNSVSLGGVGGSWNHALTTSQMPTHSHTFSDSVDVSGSISGTASGTTAGANTTHWHDTYNWALSGGATTTGKVLAAGTNFGQLQEPTITGGASVDHAHAFSGSVTGTFSGSGTASGTTGNAGSGSSHNNLQPTILVNKIIYTGV